MNNNAIPAIRCLIAMTILGAAGSAIAQTLPRRFDASPDFYRVVAENDKYVVIEANYKPGHRSKFFSSRAHLFYVVSDCHLCRHFPDGQVVDLGPWLPGFAAEGPSLDQTALENVGKNFCRMVIFESK